MPEMSVRSMGARSYRSRSLHHSPAGLCMKAETVEWIALVFVLIVIVLAIVKMIYHPEAFGFYF